MIENAIIFLSFHTQIQTDKGSFPEKILIQIQFCFYKNILKKRVSIVSGSCWAPRKHKLIT